MGRKRERKRSHEMFSAENREKLWKLFEDEQDYSFVGEFGRLGSTKSGQQTWILNNVRQTTNGPIVSKHCWFCVEEILNIQHCRKEHIPRGELISLRGRPDKYFDQGANKDNVGIHNVRLETVGNDIIL